MNKIIFVIIIITIVNCDKEYNVDIEYNDKYTDDYQNELYPYSVKDKIGKVFAIKNVPNIGSTEWIANSEVSIAGHNTNQFNFYFDTYDNLTKNQYRETLAFMSIDRKEGKYQIKNYTGREFDISSCEYYRVGADGDVALRDWYPSQFHDCFFNIDKIDSLNKKIYYSFDVYFDYETQWNRDQKAKGVDWPPHYWSKNINFLGGRGVVDFPK